MLCSKVIEIIERDYPGEYAMDWDNVGLLAGRDDKEVERIYLALDATDEVIDDAVRCGADMLITHHPLIFGGMKQITNQDFTGRRILELIRHDISYYAMHTNYDVLRMGTLAADMLGFEGQEVLEVTREEYTDNDSLPAQDECSGEKRKVQKRGIGKIGRLHAEITLKQCCEEVKRTFQLDTVRVFGDFDCQARTIAICPGSGKSVIEEALKRHVDVLIAGDIGHHEGIDAVARGMAVIDAGHYGIEYIFIEDMRRYLLECLEGFGKDDIIPAPICHPFVNV